MCLTDVRVLVAAHEQQDVAASLGVLLIAQARRGVLGDRVLGLPVEEGGA